MVNARLHIICGNCGCNKYLVHSITERFDDDNEKDGSEDINYAALITCHIEILMDIEAELEIEADDNESRLWLTVGDVINYFENNRS